MTKKDVRDVVSLLQKAFGRRDRKTVQICDNWTERERRGVLRALEVHNDISFAYGINEDKLPSNHPYHNLSLGEKREFDLWAYLHELEKFDKKSSEANLKVGARLDSRVAYA